MGEKRPWDSSSGPALFHEEDAEKRVTTMNDYASFRKCDFQVHSPRDPNWRGPRPCGLGDSVNGAVATEVDVHATRRKWAFDFVDACQARDLRAVALTDHHDMVMVPYVHAEIADRTASGNDPDLWVFPGMELTAKDGVQSIILFDPSLEQDWWMQAQGKLGIVHAGIEPLAAVAKDPVQLSIPYDEISHHLDEVEELRSRYIVMPNVSQGGQHTVVRNGWHGRFRKMKYVGGYMDAGQNIHSCNATQKKRLSGTDEKWGDRYVYPLPTSDSRDANYPQLGTNNTWIKLSLPTVESIRQAFLAWQSRVRIEEPIFPTVTIKALHVKGANPLADASLFFSPELNSIIGGRGSGKSTVLEYLA